MTRNIKIIFLAYLRYEGDGDVKETNGISSQNGRLRIS